MYEQQQAIARSNAFARQRGVTMVSVLLLTVSLLTIGLLAIKSSVREVNQAGQLVARERAMMVAQAAVDLATARLRELDDAGLDGALAGSYPGDCSNPCEDCIPGTGAGALITGRRNEVISGSGLSCGGRPCMRPGSLAELPVGVGTAGTEVRWCKLPFRSIVPEGDAEAYVSVWVRNNAADVLGEDGSGSWTDDSDSMVTVTAQVEIRNTVVAVEQEVRLQGVDATRNQVQSADEGYGGGHNNDNSSVATCTDDFQSATEE
jgi:hypothetical protein